VNPGCDDELNRIVMKALAPAREDRYQTALELQEELEHYCESFTMVVKQKELASFVSTLFSDTRSELKALVERQLSLIAKGEATGSGAHLPVPFELSISGSSSRSRPQSQSRTRVNSEASPLQPRSSLTWVAAAALFMVGGGTVYLLTARPPAPALVAAAPKETAPSPKPEAVQPATVTIQLRASPPDAKLFLDNQSLPSNPTSKVIAVDGAVHRVRAEAAGYRTVVEEFSPRRDGTVEINLVKVESPSVTQRPSTRVRVPIVKPAAKPAAQPSAAQPPAAQPSAAQPPAPKACTQPFFIDSDGIRRLRPECI
jgi:serine/threonine-protein kinase